MFHENKCPTQKNNCIHVSTKTSWTKDVSTWKPFFPSTMKINQGHWFTGPPATSLRPLRWTLVAPQWNSGRGTNIDPATGTCGTCSTCFHLANKFRNSMIEVKTGLQIMHCRTYYVHRILPVCIWSHAKVPRGEVPLYNRIKNTRSWELWVFDQDLHIFHSTIMLMQFVQSLCLVLVKPSTFVTALAVLLQYLFGL